MKKRQKWWEKYDRTNQYFKFIENCRVQTYSKDTNLHLHHILPKHLFQNDPEEQNYCESEENLIILSIEVHITAHHLLYKIYQNPRDQGAVYLLTGQMNEARHIWRRLGAEATHSLLSSQNANFWNSEFQTEMASRSMAREDALEIRSEAGRVGGRARNLNRVITAKDRYLFFYKREPVFCILNCETGGDVIKVLQLFSLQTEEKKQWPQRVTRLLRDSTKSLNGWSCEKIVFSSVNQQRI